MESITGALLEPDKIVECKLSKPSCCSESSRENVEGLEKSDIKSNCLKSNGDINFCFDIKKNDNADSIDIKGNCKIVNDVTTTESHEHVNTLDVKNKINDVYSDYCSNTKINHIINAAKFVESVQVGGNIEPIHDGLLVNCVKIDQNFMPNSDQKHLIDVATEGGSTHDAPAGAISVSSICAHDINSNNETKISQHTPHLHNSSRYHAEDINLQTPTSLTNNDASSSETVYLNDDDESRRIFLENIASFKGCGNNIGTQELELENYNIDPDSPLKSGFNIEDGNGCTDKDKIYNNENNFSDSLHEMGTCITKIDSESVTCMSDCTKVIFEGVCLDDSLISVSDDKTDNDISSSSVSCYMQTVVEGTLQPLNINEIKKAEQLRKDSVLFAAVSEELKQIDSESESERMEGIVVQSVENITNINDEYNKDNIHLINLTEPPPIKLNSEIEKSDDEKDDSQYASTKIEYEKYHNFNMPVEGKPFLLKILPLKNGHDLWFPDDLNLAIAEKGSVLLRLCAAPEAGDEDLIEGPQADFSALLLHEKGKVPNIDNEDDHYIESPSLFKTITTNDDEEDDDDRIFAPPIIIETPKPLLPLSLISRQDFMERLQRPESPHLYEELPLSLKWKVRNAASMSMKRKCLSVPFTSVYRSRGPKPNAVNLTARGRRRGRPPLHNRGLIHNQFSTKKKFIEGPIKFRPPTPPSFLLSEESKDSVDFKSNSITKKSLDPRTLCPSLAGLKKAAPGSILSRQLQAFKAESKKDESKDESVSEASDDLINTDGDKITVVGKISIPCEFCSSVFRKKSALTMHLKMRHRFLRKCPICKEVIRVKGKLGLKEHNLEAHSDIKSFQCEFCDESFQIPHHLKDHIKLNHDNGRCSDDDENSNESGSETDSKNGVCINKSKANEPKKSNRNIKVTKNLVKNDMDNDIKLCKELVNAKDKRKIESFVEDSDSKESSSVTWEGRTRLRSKGQAQAEKNINSGKLKEQDISGESGNESDDEGDDSSGSSESEVEEPKNYFCSQCEEGFSHLFKLKHHHKERHSSSHGKDSAVTEDDDATDEDIEDDEDDNSDVDSHSKRLENKYSCKICNKKCKSLYQLRIHNLQHNLTLKQKGFKTRGTLLSVEPSESVVLRSSKVCEKKDINSDINESQPIRPNLRGQKSSISAVSKNVEEKLKYPVANKESVSNKLRVLGDKNRPSYIIRRGRMYYCTKCNVNFKREKSMTYHLKKVHETLYPFRACPHCSRVFRSCGPYVRHLTQHSGKKCPVDGCKAKYKIMRLIKKHQRNAHPDKPYRCSRCVELFVTEKELQNHVESSHVEKMKGDDDEEEEDDEDEENDESSNVKKTCCTGTVKVTSKKSGKSDEEEPKKNSRDFKLAGKRKLSKHCKNEVEVENEDSKSKGKLYNGSKCRAISATHESMLDLDEVKGYSNEYEKKAKNFPNKNFKIGSKRKFAKVDDEDENCMEDDEIEVKDKMRISTNVVEHLPIRRSRSMLVSYKEEDDEEASSSEKLVSQQNSQSLKESCSSEPKLSVEKSPLSIESKELSLNRSLPNSFSDPNMSIETSTGSKLISSSFTVPVVKQKRAYNRKVPYNKKRQEISWTAALKAKYGLNSKSNNGTTNEPGISASSIYSPAITADVVRRVAESLLSKHQEQQQKQQEKLQKKLKKQQKKMKLSSSIKYSSASTLPRIPYGSHLNSRDDSLSSFGDSSHTDQLSDYCSSSHSSVNKVPEEEDGGPAKVLRFDSF